MFDGLAYEGGITGAARETLSCARQMQQDKRTRLHADWHREVFDIIESRIVDAVDARSVHKVEERLQRNARVRILCTAVDVCTCVSATTQRPALSSLLHRQQCRGRLDAVDVPAAQHDNV